MNDLISMVNDVQFGYVLSAILGSSFVGIWLKIRSENRQKKVDLYSIGIKLLSERQELYYRILRRDIEDKEQRKHLIDLMHENQLQIQNHKSMLMTDSLWLAESFSDVYNKIIDITQEKFRDAWKKPLLEEYTQIPEERKIDIGGLINKYATDCRNKVSVLRSPLVRFVRFVRRMCRGN